MGLLQETKDLCKLYGIYPARSRGQNFLINQTVYDKIIAAANLKSSDIVLEVGPGLGFLTILLAKQAKRVVAVELDKKLAAILPARLATKGIKNVSVINANILDFPFFIKASEDKKVSSFKFQVSSYKIVANLPYNITSIFLRKFLETKNKPRTMTLMLQREVAQRLAAPAGEMSLLGLSVQFYARPQLVAQVAKNDFWPEPKVASALVNLAIKDKLPLAQPDIKLFFRLARIGFSAKRKMLKNNLAAGFKITPAVAEKFLIQADLKMTCRAQDLDLDNWLTLFTIIKNKI